MRVSPAFCRPHQCAVRTLSLVLGLLRGCFCVIRLRAMCSMSTRMPFSHLLAVHANGRTRVAVVADRGHQLVDREQLRAVDDGSNGQQADDIQQFIFYQRVNRHRHYCVRLDLATVIVELCPRTCSFRRCVANRTQKARTYSLSPASVN